MMLDLWPWAVFQIHANGPWHIIGIDPSLPMRRSASGACHHSCHITEPNYRGVAGADGPICKSCLRLLRNRRDYWQTQMDALEAPTRD